MFILKMARTFPIKSLNYIKISVFVYATNIWKKNQPY